MTEAYPGPADPELALVPPGSDILNQVAMAVPESSIKAPAFQVLIDAMLAFARGEQGNAQRPTLVGLAAPQVGIPRRIIIVGVNAEGKGEVPDLKAYINPKLVRRSRETALYREGCYSTGSVCGVLKRSALIKVQALDSSGTVVEEEHEGVPARIFQHEIDHLDGIRFPDRVTDDKRLHWVPPEEFGQYREHWQDWPKLASREQWTAIKTGSM